MSCECGQCRQHYRTLGIAYGIPEESAILEAYQASVKQWHPDLYENYASLRADAEEHFKQIQVAFRELKEHNAVVEESPEESAAVKPGDAPASSPSLSFGDAPGCLVASEFTPEVEEIIARNLGKSDTALAIVDLGGPRSRAAAYSQFFLLAARGMMVRDARNMVSLLWYKDLGEVSLANERKNGIFGLSQIFHDKSSGGQHNCLLDICRDNGTLFFSIADQVDDRVKNVIYNFLLRQKPEGQS